MNLKEFKILENYCKASERGFDSYSPSSNKSCSFSLPYQGRARERWEGVGG
jgi:hypothetical protein